jgi:zinc/manganese transport system ATP-binding protein
MESTEALASLSRRAAHREADHDAPVISLHGGTLVYGDRVLWQALELDVRPGEFLAVLGPNGSGKTSLLRVILGRRHLTAGSLTVLGHVAGHAGRHIGYVPQHRPLPAHTQVRARDAVRLGVYGHRWGPWPGRRAARRRADELLEEVGAAPFAEVPLGRLSGGEQQRVRVAQALAADPRVLLCDEPLLSLDLQYQSAVMALIDRCRRSAGTAVVFVTHEINPVLGMADRVLYLAPAGFRVGPPEDVMTTSALTELYGTRVDVVHVRGRVVIVGAPDEAVPHDHGNGPNGTGANATASGEVGRA